MTDGDACGAKGGGCLCGSVRYEITGPMRPVLACHCTQCLRTHGHYASYTSVRLDDIAIHGEQDLAWYTSSDIARRGFCRVCGSRLFWECFGRGDLAVAAGTLDIPTGLSTIAHIFVDDRSDYYEIPEDIEQWPQGFRAT